MESLRDFWRTEHLTIHVLLEFSHPLPPNTINLGRMDYAADRIDRLLVDEKLHLLESTWTPPCIFIV